MRMVFMPILKLQLQMSLVAVMLIVIPLICVLPKMVEKACS